MSGVLVVTLENACKVMPALQRLEKEYVGIMKLHKDAADNDVDQALTTVRGRITQRPPVRSAVARRERERTVSSFTLLERDGRDLLFSVICEAGTYVRVLCHDIGKHLGGAHMTELRRVRSGRFTEQHAVTAQDLEKAYTAWKKTGDERIREYVLPVEEAIDHVPKIIVKDSAVYSLAHGSPLYGNGIAKYEDTVRKNALVALLTLRGELIALGQAVVASSELLRTRKIVAKTDRVIIDRTAYPKMGNDTVPLP